MKQLLIFILLAVSAPMFGQTRLDTVYVRTVQLKGEEWWWSIDGLSVTDSVSKKQYRKIQKALETANPSSATNVTIDSLWGPFAMVIFRDYWSSPEARENMGQGIDTKLRAYAPLAPYIAEADERRLERFTQRKNSGKFSTQ